MVHCFPDAMLFVTVSDNSPFHLFFVQWDTSKGPERSILPYI